MSHEDTIAISATVTLLTQVVKRVLPDDDHGPLIVTMLSLLAIVLWVVSGPIFPPDRTHIWTIFTGWAVIWAEAIGLYHGARVATSTVDLLRERQRRRRVKKVLDADEEAAA